MAGEPDESPDGPRLPKGLPVNPDTLIWGALFLSVFVIVLQAKRTTQLERELQAVRGNYAGVVSVLNTRKPCGCSEQQEGASNGTTGLHSPTSPDSVPAPE